MAFPPTRYRDINTWLPYFSERITPVVPTRLRDAHFYTIGPHMHLHHLDYVVLQRHHQLVCAFQHEQLTFWPRVHRDTDKLMHMLQFYHHHLRAHDDQGGLIDFLYGTAGNRAKEMIHSAQHASRDLRRPPPRDANLPEESNPLGLDPQPSVHAEDHTPTQHLTPKMK